MRASSFSTPVVLQHVGHGPPKRHSLLGSQVALFIFRKRGQQEHRNICATEQIDNSRSPTLAPPAEAESDLSDASAVRDRTAAQGIDGDRVDNCGSLLGGEETLSVREAGWRLDNRLHSIENTTALQYERQLPP